MFKRLRREAYSLKIVGVPPSFMNEVSDVSAFRTVRNQLIQHIDSAVGCLSKKVSHASVSKSIVHPRPVRPPASLSERSSFNDMRLDVEDVEVLAFKSFPTALNQGFLQHQRKSTQLFQVAFTQEGVIGHLPRDVAGGMVDKALIRLPPGIMVNFPVLPHILGPGHPVHQHLLGAMNATLPVKQVLMPRRPDVAGVRGQPHAKGYTLGGTHTGVEEVSNGELLLVRRFVEGDVLVRGTLVLVDVFRGVHVAELNDGLAVAPTPLLRPFLKATPRLRVKVA